MAITALALLAASTVAAGAYQLGGAVDAHASATHGSSKRRARCLNVTHGRAASTKGVALAQHLAGKSCKEPARCVGVKRVHTTHASDRKPAKHRAVKKCKAGHPLEKPSASAAPSVSIAPIAPAPPAEPLLPAAPAAPLNLVPPSIAGTATQGDALSATSGSWTEAPTSYAYQWQECNALGEACADAPGATASGYTLTASDAGHTMRVLVTASNAGGSTSAISSPSPRVSAAQAASGPLVGSATLEPSPDTDSAGSAEAFQYVASASGMVRSISLYVDAADTAPAIAVGLYSNLSEAPGRLLATATISPVDVGAWNSVAVAPVAVSSGTTYWLAALAPSGKLALRDIAKNGGATENSASRSLSELPSPWASGRSWANSPASFFASGEEAVQAPPTAPTNTERPSVIGSAVEGEDLTASIGTWTGTPTAYAYQWQDCNSSGASCVNITGATSATRKLATTDVGHTVRVFVTASNAAGSSSQPSPVTAVVVKAEEVRCSKTLKASEGAAALESTIKEAAGGESICLEEGSYPELVMIGGRGESGRSSYVSIRPAKGAKPTVAGLDLRDSSFERYEGLLFTAGVSLDDTPGYAGSHDYQFLHDSWERSKSGIGISGGQEGRPIKRVLLENDYMYFMEIEKHGEGHGSECDAGSDGQDVSIGEAEGVVVRDSTFYETQWHYIQGGGAGPEGVTVENNLFMGKDPYECAHLNVWQIYQGGENDTFRNNIVHGEGTKELPDGGHEEASVDWLMWENGPASGECSVDMKNSVVENNLVVDGNNAEIFYTEGLTIQHNTVVGENGGLSVRSDICGPGKNYTMTHNLGVEASLSLGSSTEGNVFDYNATTDTSADADGSTHYVTKWDPSWITTTWNPFKEVEEGNHFPKPPAGYYIPNGLTVEAGYEGGAGP
jgi:hypothetical protein